MIAKEYRLTEREFRKVLSRKKPFFSYMFIANVLENKIGHGRCGILLSAKVTRGSVNRNFFRRKFYDMMLPFLKTTESSKISGTHPTIPPSHHPASIDIVLVPKKGTILDHKNEIQVAEFEKNIMFLMKKIKEEITITKRVLP